MNKLYIIILNLNLFDLNIVISVLELDFYLTKDLVITLPNIEIIGIEKIIIMGESINRYINGHKNYIIYYMCRSKWTRTT